MTTLIEYSIVAVGSFLAFCMFSTLYGKGNPLYSLAEESYLGFGTGLSIVMNLAYIWKTGFLNIMAGDWVLILAVVLGIMILFRVSSKYSYISRIPIAIVLGAQFGLSLRTIIFSGFTQQIQSVIFPLFSGGTQMMLYNWTIAICVIFMLTFFFYTIEIEGPLKTSAAFGEYLLYASFGAIFAQTFMGRLGLFIGFMQSYTVPSWEKPFLVGSLLLVFGLVYAMDKTGLLEKLTPED